MLMALALLLAQVTMGTAQQQIDCLGVAGSIFGDNGTANEGAWSDFAIDAIFDPAKGMGATCIRMGIANIDDGTGTRQEDANPGFNNTIIDLQRIKRRVGSSLKIIVGPWSPNTACKNNSSVVDGNYVGSSCDASWAAYIASAVDDLTNAGVKPDYVFWQNEPGTGGVNCAFGHEGACWTPAQSVSFNKVLGPLLTARGIQLTGPETSQWGEAQAYIDACTADSTCNAQIGNIVTAHQYTTAISGPLSAGSRRSWQTEVSDLNSPNQGMTGNGGGLAQAQLIHVAFVTGGASAWFAWWGVTSHPNDDGILELGDTVTKRLYALGNFSKFVKPGMVRYSLTGSPPAGVLVSLYKDPISNNIAIVAINTNVSGTSLTVTLDSSSKVQTTVPWLTDATHNLSIQTPIPVLTNKSITITLQPSSVTTLSGLGT